MKKVIERGNTTMCQMFGGFFNKNFGEFINTNLEILLSTNSRTLEKIPCSISQQVICFDDDGDEYLCMKLWLTLNTRIGTLNY